MRRLLGAGVLALGCASSAPEASPPAGPANTVHATAAASSAPDVPAAEAARPTNVASPREREAAPTPAAAEPTPGLTDSRVAAVIHDSADVFRDCHRRVARQRPGLTGTLSVAFTVTPAGTVQELRFTRGSLADGAVRACVARVLQQLSFPEAERPTTTSWTFSFER